MTTPTRAAIEAGQLGDRETPGASPALNGGSRGAQHAGFFDAVVHQARDAGLMSDEHFTVDGTVLEPRPLPTRQALKLCSPDVPQLDVHTIGAALAEERARLKCSGVANTRQMCQEMAGSAVVIAHAVNSKRQRIGCGSGNRIGSAPQRARVATRRSRSTVPSSGIGSSSDVGVSEPVRHVVDAGSRLQQARPELPVASARFGVSSAAARGPLEHTADISTS